MNNAKTTKFLLQSAFYTSKGLTCNVFSVHGFWFKFYDQFGIAPTQLSTFYAYLITKIGNRNHKYIKDCLP